MPDFECGPVSGIRPDQCVDVSRPDTANDFLGVQIDTPHCGRQTVEDIREQFRTLLQKFSGAAADVAQRLDAADLLPRLIDRGHTTLTLSAPMNAGHYPTGIVVEPETFLDARLHIDNGRLEGTLRFTPYLVKHNPDGLPGIGTFYGSVQISEIRIHTDAAGHVVFGASARPETVNLPRTNIPLTSLFEGTPLPSSLTRDITSNITPLLFGTRDRQVTGTAGQLMERIISHVLPMPESERNALAGMVNANLARVGVRIEPVTRWEDLTFGPLRLRGMHMGLEVIPDFTTGGLRVRIPEAGIESLNIHPLTSCPQGPSDSTVTGMHIRNLETVLERIDPSDVSAGFYPVSAEGSIGFGGASLVGGDLRFLPFAEELHFSLTPGEAPGDLSFRVHLPPLGLSHAALSLAEGARTLGLEWNAESLRFPRDAFFSLQNGEPSFRFEMDPGPVSVLARLQPETGAALLGADCSLIRMERTQGQPWTVADVVGCRSSLTGSWGPLTNPLRTEGEFSVKTGLEGRLAFAEGEGLRIDHLSAPSTTYRLHTTTEGVTSALEGSASVALSPTERGPRAGLTQTVSLALHHDRIAVALPGLGQAHFQGRVLGSFEVVHIAGPEEAPRFLPVANTFRLTLTTGGVLSAHGQSIALRAPLSLSDDGRGVFRLAGSTHLQGLSSRLHVGIDLGDARRELHRGGRTLTYYDPSRLDAFPISLDLTTGLPVFGNLNFHAQAQVSGLSSGTPAVNFHGSLPLSRTVSLNGLIPGFSGTASVRRGGLEVNGNRLALRLPDIHVAASGERDGNRYRIEGTLSTGATIRGSIRGQAAQAHLDVPQSVVRLSGRLRVFETTPSGEERIYTLPVTAPMRFGLHAGLRHARLSFRLERLESRPSASSLQAGDLRLPEGFVDSLIDVRGASFETSIDVPQLLRRLGPGRHP